MPGGSKGAGKSRELPLGSVVIGLREDGPPHQRRHHGVSMLGHPLEEVAHDMDPAPQRRAHGGGRMAFLPSRGTSLKENYALQRRNLFGTLFR
jgi:hypothetical protein